MDPWKTDDFSQPLNSNPVPTSSVHPTLHPLHNSHPEPRQRPEVEVKDPISSRKVQKADREKLRRDRLNEHFLELGNALDPDRPKNDKATILTDTIQVLKDLTAEVNRLKAECAALSEESRELTQEKNELREEKASLKSDIDNLNLQYQQRLRVMFPWTTAIDPSVVMAPPYSYPVPLPMHPPALQPFPFFGNQNPGAIPNPCSTFIPYPNPANHHIHMDRPSYECASTSRISSNQDSRSKTTSGHCRGSNDNKSDDSNDVVTDLELKTPGSTVQQVGFKSIESDDARQRRYCSLRYAGTEQLPPGEERKGKQSQRKERSIVDGSSSSRRSSSQGFQDSSSNSMGHPKVQ